MAIAEGPILSTPKAKSTAAAAGQAEGADGSAEAGGGAGGGVRSRGGGGRAAGKEWGGEGAGSIGILAIESSTGDVRWDATG